MAKSVKRSLIAIAKGALAEHSMHCILINDDDIHMIHFVFIEVGCTARKPKNRPRWSCRNKKPLLGANP
jgi:hypothetical protein